MHLTTDDADHFVSIRRIARLVGYGVTGAVVALVGLAMLGGGDDASAASGPLDDIVDDVVEPIDDAAPVVEDAVVPVDETVEPVTEPIAEAAAPVVEQVAAPVAENAAPIVEQVVQPVIEPVVRQVVQPVVEPVGNVVDPIVEPVGDVVDPIIESVDPVIEPVDQVAPSPTPVPPTVAPIPTAERPQVSPVDSAVAIPDTVTSDVATPAAVVPAHAPTSTVHQLGRTPATSIDARTSPAVAMPTSPIAPDRHRPTPRPFRGVAQGSAPAPALVDGGANALHAVLPVGATPPGSGSRHRIDAVISWHSASVISTIERPG